MMLINTDTIPSNFIEVLTDATINRKIKWNKYPCDEMWSITNNGITARITQQGVLKVGKYVFPDCRTLVYAINHATDESNYHNDVTDFLSGLIK